MLGTGFSVISPTYLFCSVEKHPSMLCTASTLLELLAWFTKEIENLQTKKWGWFTQAGLTSIHIHVCNFLVHCICVFHYSIGHYSVWKFTENETCLILPTYRNAVHRYEWAQWSQCVLYLIDVNQAFSYAQQNNMEYFFSHFFFLWCAP